MAADLVKRKLLNSEQLKVFVCSWQKSAHRTVTSASGERTRKALSTGVWKFVHKIIYAQTRANYVTIRSLCALAMPHIQLFYNRLDTALFTWLAVLKVFHIRTTKDITRNCMNSTSLSNTLMWTQNWRFRIWTERMNRIISVLIDFSPCNWLKFTQRNSYFKIFETNYTVQ